jgi:glycosyltransferase involved in cell wall biosynthesis
MTSTERPTFSVIIATRNRSTLLAVSLGSVLDQQFRDFEVVVVDDGSSEEHGPRYHELAQARTATVRLIHLLRTERGHGPGYALNYGVSQSHGEFLCFLDDDDQWIDAEHLGRAALSIRSKPEPDLILANQRAFRADKPVPEVIWIEDLSERLRGDPDASGAYAVTPAELLRCQGHCHLNTTIVSRSLFDKIGGFDESQRYEPDRDLYLRLLDRAGSIKYLPFIVSRHNIPDPASKASVSTSQSELSKRLYQLRTCDKAVLFATRDEVRRHEMLYRAYILRHIAVEAGRMGQLESAAYYAREGLMARFTLGWLASTVFFAFRRRFRRPVSTHTNP